MHFDLTNFSLKTYVTYSLYVVTIIEAPHSQSVLAPQLPF
jgi:hypothetical protein